jgi:uncharacterized membrane protein
MLYFLMVLNLIAILFTYLCWISIARTMRAYFAAFFALTLSIGVILFGLTQPHPWTPMAWVGFLFRGWLVFSVLSGAVACYLKTTLGQKK